MISFRDGMCYVVSGILNTQVCVRSIGPYPKHYLLCEVCIQTDSNLLDSLFKHCYIFMILMSVLFLSTNANVRLLIKHSTITTTTYAFSYT